jgi:hypothetical protein
MAASRDAPNLGSYRSPPIGPHTQPHLRLPLAHGLLPRACFRCLPQPSFSGPYAIASTLSARSSPLATSLLLPPTTAHKRSTDHVTVPHLLPATPTSHSALPRSTPTLPPPRRLQPLCAGPSALHHPLYLLPPKPNAPATSITARHSSKLQAQFCRHCGRMPNFEYGRVGGVG